MKNWFNFSENDRKDIIIQASVTSGLPPAAIEKDWWAMIVLKAVFNTEYSKHIVFKGGTSLSKSWKIIERFSEDIDIAVDRNYLGFSGDLSKSQVTKLRKKSCQFFSTDFKAEVIKELLKQSVKDFEVKVRPFTDSDTDPIAIDIEYKSLTETIRYIKPKILIEGSARSLREPFESKRIRSIIGYTYPEEIFVDGFIEVPTVRPTRTLWEKIFLLHEEFQKPINRKIRTERMTRHLYDISKLMDTDFCDEAIYDDALYSKIVAHRKSITKISWVDYSNHAYSKINFIPPDSVIEDWKKDYKEMRESMIYGEADEFEVLISKLKGLNEKINGIEN